MLFTIGVTLLAASLLLAAGIVMDFVQLPSALINGESTIHSVARLAIVGCLLAAIGSLE